jgi:hypothetical protein
MLTALVAVEALGALAAAGVVIVAIDFLGTTVVPPVVAALCLGFAVGAFAVVRALRVRHRWRFLYVFVLQEVVFVGAIIGLIFSGEPVLWVALGLSMAGTALTVVAMMEEKRFGDAASSTWVIER